MNRKDHFIVCGHSILAVNTILQLNQRGQKVTVITNLPEDEANLLDQRLGGNFDMILGDSNDSAILKKPALTTAGRFWRSVTMMPITPLWCFQRKISAKMSKLYWQ